MHKRVGQWSIVVLLIIAVSFTWLLNDWLVFKRSPMIKPTAASIDYMVQPGTNIKKLTADLENLGLLHNSWYFLFLAEWQHASRRLKAGEYRFLPGITPSQLLDQIVNGRVLKHQLTFVEGWRFDRILEAIRQQPRIIHTLFQLPPETIMAKLGLPGVSPEGWFFPDTYSYTTGTTDLSILRQAHQAMLKRLSNEWKNRAQDLPYDNSYQALIAASLIEKETGVASERVLVASVIVNRLKKGMLLQIDPTIIYGLGQLYTGRLRSSDLIKDTPYNTYRRKGLPPTPIAMPSAASLHAALHPAVSDVLYFVARGNGGHQFSTNLKEHEQAVRNYLHMRHEMAAKQNTENSDDKQKKCEQAKPTPIPLIPCKSIPSELKKQDKIRYFKGLDGLQ